MRRISTDFRNDACGFVIPNLCTSPQNNPCLSVASVGSEATWKICVSIISQSLYYTTSPKPFNGDRTDTRPSLPEVARPGAIITLRLRRSFNATASTSPTEAVGATPLNIHIQAIRGLEPKVKVETQFSTCVAPYFLRPQGLNGYRRGWGFTSPQSHPADRWLNPTER